MGRLRELWGQSLAWQHARLRGLRGALRGVSQVTLGAGAGTCLFSGGEPIRKIPGPAMLSRSAPGLVASLALEAAH